MLLSSLRRFSELRSGPDHFSLFDASLNGVRSLYSVVLRKVEGEAQGQDCFELVGEAYMYRAINTEAADNAFREEREALLG